MRAILLTLVLTFVSLISSSSGVWAQSVVADPEDLAITPSELPPGFSYDPAATTREHLNDGIGTGYRSALEREPTPENRASGPYVVSQVIFRIDHLIVPGDFFRELREDIARDQDLQPVPGVPSSPTTVFLAKRGEHEGEQVVLYAIGSVHDNFIFFSFIGGVDAATPFDAAVQLANLSIDKYEALKNAPPAVQAEHLYRALLRAPFSAPHLADPFGSPTVSSGEPGERSLSHGVIGSVDVDFEDGTTAGYITYLVYPSEAEAQASFDASRAQSQTQSRATITGEFSPAEVAVPVYCVNSISVLDGRPMGASVCLALVGNVEVGAFTALPSATGGDEPGTGELLRTGLRHLQRLRHAN